MSSSDSNALGLSSNLDTEVGRIVVENGLATRGEIDFCREQQKQSSDPNQRSLGDLLIENNFITANQAKRIRKQLAEERSRQAQIPGYELISKLGKGAMATVFKARQLSLDRIVAIKVLPKKMSENAEFVERFYKEGKAAARLAHNNIVQAIDVGVSPEGYHYFVMEYIEGKTVYDMMQPPPVGQSKVFNESEALDIAIQVCEALVHAHERNLVHRDVKPKNIILTPGGVAKLTDLGLARAVDDTVAAESEAGKAYGTPYYISPEQIRGDLDIYSLGATLYHLVTSRPPFDGETPSAVMHKHLKQALVPPDHLNTSLSAGIGEIIEVAMAKRREDRYESTTDMLEDLRLVRVGQSPIHARHTVDLDRLASLEETGKTVDISADGGEAHNKPPAKIPTIWVVSAIAALSVLGNLIWLFYYLHNK